MRASRYDVLLVLTGLVAGLLLSSLLGGTGVLAQSSYGSRPGQVPLQGQGRFQVSSYGHGRGGYGCYIIDTTTGQTWHAESNSSPSVLAPKLP